MATAAIIQLLVMKNVFGDISHNDSITQNLLIGLVIVVCCVAMLASIGYEIVIEKDWVPQVFQGDILTSGWDSKQLHNSVIEIALFVNKQFVRKLN